MIKKILKFIFKFTLGIFTLLILGYIGFRSVEYITGNKYVKYLKQNIESKPLNSNFNYEIMNSDIESNNLIFVGEIHGFKEPNKFDFNFFKHLNNKFNVKNYICEFDYVQSKLLNEFINTGNEKLLKKVLEKWVVIQGRNNKDYYEKYIHLYKLNKKLPDNKKFKFIGIDKIQDIELTIEYINQLCIQSKIQIIEKDEIDNISVIEEKICKLTDPNKVNQNYELNHILENIKSLNNKTRREEILYNNFKTLYQNYKLDTNKTYAFFGLFHTLLYKTNNRSTLASMIRTNHIVPNDKVLTIGFSFVDSKMVMESEWLPSFIRSEDKYTKIDISYDNILFTYLYGINDLKRATKENSKNIIKFNGKNSPYHKSDRLKSSYKMINLFGNMEFTEKEKEYMQYNIFVRNSDWAEPKK